MCFPAAWILKARRISPKKSTERLQQKRELPGNKYSTYTEKWLTVNEMAFPLNRGGFSSLSVISIHSCFSELDSLKSMQTRATDKSMSFLWGSLSDKGTWTAIGFRKSTVFELVIRRIGPGKICFCLNGLCETSCNYRKQKMNKVWDEWFS